MQLKQQQQKAWNHQLKVLTRKNDTSHKQIQKMFPFCSTLQGFNDKINTMMHQNTINDQNIIKEQLLTKNKLISIHKHLKQLKQTLKYFQHTNEFLVKVRTLSQNLYNKMEGFKGKMAQNYDDLADIEDKLNNQLVILDKKIQNIKNGEDNIQHHQNQQNIITNKTNPTKKIPNVKNQTIQQQNDQTKIQILERKMKQKQQICDKIDYQIKLLGKGLGWVQQDHQDFITIWNRAQQSQKNYFQIQDQLKSYFSLYTQEQIKQHMKKYMKFKKLNEEKKQSIYQYKILKEEKKNQQLITIQIAEDQIAKRQSKQAQIKKYQQQQKLLKEKVEQWKHQKEILKKKQIQQKKQIERRQKLLQKQQKNQQQQRRKQILQQWKAQQLQKKQQQMVENSRKRPVSAVNKQTEQRIKQREEKIINQKLQRVLEKKIQAQQFRKKQQQIKEKKIAKFAYVNSKVEEKTTAIKEKQRKKFDGINKKEAETFGGKLLMTGIRAIPSWRQGL